MNLLEARLGDMHYTNMALLFWTEYCKCATYFYSAYKLMEKGNPENHLSFSAQMASWLLCVWSYMKTFITQVTSRVSQLRMDDTLFLQMVAAAVGEHTKK